MRGPRKSRDQMPADAAGIEAKLAELKMLQASLRGQLRRLKNSSTSVRKLEDKARKQLGYAKYTIEQIKALNEGWDEWSFYKSAAAVRPAPRGRRPKAAGA